MRLLATLQMEHDYGERNRKLGLDYDDHVMVVKDVDMLIYRDGILKVYDNNSHMMHKWDLKEFYGIIVQRDKEYCWK